MAERQKNPKGSITVEIYRDAYRLRWRWQGQRFAFYTGKIVGWPGSKEWAEGLASRIYRDMLADNFDPTLAKYRPADTRSDTQLDTQKKALTVADLFEKFIDYKQSNVTPRTVTNYKGFLGHVQKFFGQLSAVTVDVDQVVKFTSYLADVHRHTGIRKERIGMMKAAWTWAADKGLLDAATVNPWGSAQRLIKPEQVEPIKPLSLEEIGAIIEAFRTDIYYSHYHHFVTFLLSTGCRPGEAIGLRWGDVATDCRQVVIRSQWTRGNRKPPKNKKPRSFALTDKLQVMLTERRPKRPQAEDLVFPAPEGGPINDANFGRRAWKTILKRLEIDHCKVYSTRHSLISHALDIGMSPVSVAELTGHSPRVLLDSYAHAVKAPRLPEL